MGLLGCIEGTPDKDGLTLADQRKLGALLDAALKKWASGSPVDKYGCLFAAAVINRDEINTMFDILKKALRKSPAICNQSHPNRSLPDVPSSVALGKINVLTKINSCTVAAMNSRSDDGGCFGVTDPCHRLRPASAHPISSEIRSS